ncbi:mRNA-binding protein PUF3 [Sugiyamaella lignohabitans]|uniref:mRNA-binding protein PUF3 n=1 Tax=Sugiyamaella lignohabitans TaxID=796027 RepID=A0A167CDW0_9ASCO|nr:mRNA-binding protein PUF3 [Sugiyamaella lignohabitans]ANB11563.1 mRNA-binding protein PUF3 [Sugiyamaella lignohabitans]
MDLGQHRSLSPSPALSQTSFKHHLLSNHFAESIVNGLYDTDSNSLDKSATSSQPDLVADSTLIADPKLALLSYDDDNSALSPASSVDSGNSKSIHATVPSISQTARADSSASASKTQGVTPYSTSFWGSITCLYPSVTGQNSFTSQSSISSILLPKEKEFNHLSSESRTSTNALSGMDEALAHSPASSYASISSSKSQADNGFQNYITNSIPNSNQTNNCPVGPMSQPLSIGATPRTSDPGKEDNMAIISPRLKSTALLSSSDQGSVFGFPGRAVPSRPRAGTFGTAGNSDDRDNGINSIGSILNGPGMASISHRESLFQSNNPILGKSQKEAEVLAAVAAPKISSASATSTSAVNPSVQLQGWLPHGLYQTSLLQPVSNMLDSTNMGGPTINQSSKAAPNHINGNAFDELQRVQFELSLANMEVERLRNELSQLQIAESSKAYQAQDGISGTGILNNDNLRVPFDINRPMTTRSPAPPLFAGSQVPLNCPTPGPLLVPTPGQAPPTWYNPPMDRQVLRNTNADSGQTTDSRTNFNFNLQMGQTAVLSPNLSADSNNPHLLYYPPTTSPIATSPLLTNPYEDYLYNQYEPQQSNKMVPPGVVDSASAAVAAGLIESTDTFYPINFQNEPLNYRKLLERSVGCDWKLIIDRIIMDNDQQASIFLQQKLKSATKVHKAAIISAIIDQAYLLMVNRFGNFLIQRCFEYGSPEEIAGITRSMHGHVVMLAMDPFGCHVIQKTLDCVDRDTKLLIIDEMLTNVKETMVHHYACHVWQKLFELRWNGSIPPRFMQQVNSELTGSWVEVALGETGSLVVQNIFENCAPEDKKPCIDEIVNNLDTVIRGQWGNWVIQHMVEHASEPYRQTVIDLIVDSAAIYSVDQFASKTVEKMLKMGDKEIIQAFLNKVIQKHPDRPRIPLIDSMVNGILLWIGNASVPGSASKARLAILASSVVYQAFFPILLTLSELFLTLFSCF